VLRDEATELRPLARADVRTRGEERLTRGVAVPPGEVESDRPEHPGAEQVERVAP
jgi:hypothetical protein